jgi:membrane peptidoglycan carboxypeptidase
MNSTFESLPDTQPLPSARRSARRDSWHPRLRRLVRVGVLLGALGALLCAVVGWAYLASLPSVEDAPQRVQAILRAHHGVSAGMPPQKVGQAIVAVEDSRFYTNHGLDAPSMLHFTWSFVTTGSTQTAGATITEQLVKRLYVREPTTVAGKLEMMGLALKMNQAYTKPQILSMYLDAIYFGHQAWGIAQASETYFHTTPDQLNWGQASMLAGLPQAPSVYDPFKRFDLARERQQHVLSRLVATGVLTPAQAAAAYAETPSLP